MDPLSSHTPTVAPSIMDRKNPILEIAASFWEEDRYHAFRVCYRSMRELDDIVDSAKTISSRSSQGAIGLARATLQNWLESLERPRFERGDSDLREALEKMNLPLWPWRELARAMSFDLSHSRFTSFLEFARYARGAAVAPASVFVHLISRNTISEADTEGSCRVVARPLAMFSYMTHILRDFAPDYRERLVYFPTSLLAQEGVGEDSLRNAADGRQSDQFTHLARTYHAITGKYGAASRSAVTSYLPRLELRYAFSLELIWRLYSRIHENVAANDFELSRDADVSAGDVAQIIRNTASTMALPKRILDEALERLSMPPLSTSR